MLRLCYWFMGISWNVSSYNEGWLPQNVCLSENYIPTEVPLSTSLRGGYGGVAKKSPGSTTSLRPVFTMRAIVTILVLRSASAGYTTTSYFTDSGCTVAKTGVGVSVSCEFRQPPQRHTTHRTRR